VTATGGREYCPLIVAALPRLVHADADPAAGDARLGHLEDGAPDPVAVSDARLVVGEALDGEVLAELAGYEVRAPELVFPVAVRVGLIHEDRALLAAVTGEVSLPVPVDVEPANPDPPGDR
jgi:hypothetical protein